MASSDPLEREAAGRAPAVAGAIAAVVLQIGAIAVSAATLRGEPVSSPGGVLEAPRYFHDHAATNVASGVLLGLGYIALILPLHYLYRATKARRPQLPAIVASTIFLGPALLAVAGIAFQLIVVAQASAYLAHHQGDYFAAQAVGTTGAARLATGVARAGGFALGFALALVSLHAMRVGLLTRFMGVLGIISAVPFILPLGGSFLPIQWFWLGALALLISGRWPNGAPPAWSTGRAEPWPSARELRERHDADSPAPASAPPRATGSTGAPTSAKRRRKRRR